MLLMLLASLIGACLGMLGGGGSILTLPTLVYVGKVDAKQAVAMSLIIVGVTSLLGAVLHLRRGSVNLRAALIFSLTGVAGAFIGSGGTHLLSRKALMLLFAGLMLVAGSLMLRGRTAPASQSVSVPHSLGVGFGVGLLTGFLGVGGGFLIVPALVFAAGLDTRTAAGTALSVIALNSTTGAVGQLRFAKPDWNMLTLFLCFALAGMAAGVSFAHRLPDSVLRRAFAWAITALAIVIAFVNI